MKTRFKYWNWQALIPQILMALILLIALGYTVEAHERHNAKKIIWSIE